jgi:hypothetical protein
MNIRRCALALLLAISTPTLAHHDLSHNVIAIGVETQIPAESMACDTEDAAELITTAHRERGLEVAMAVIRQLQATPSQVAAGEGLCGAVLGHMTVHEQLAAEILPGSTGVIYLVRMALREHPGRVYYALISVDDILPASRADELTAEPA